MIYSVDYFPEKLSQKLRELHGDTALHLAWMGVNLPRLQMLPPNEQIEIVKQAIATLPNHMERKAMAQKLAGADWQGLI